jgi:hypothetical protein
MTDAVIAQLISQLGPLAIKQVMAQVRWLVDLYMQPAAVARPETVEEFLADCESGIVLAEIDHPDSSGWTAKERHDVAFDWIRLKAHRHGLLLRASDINRCIETTLLKLRS